MSWRSPQRTAGCTQADAATRLKQAQKSYEVAELAQTEADVVESATSVSASLAVLATIAACDAACCAALGRRSRSQDPKAAVTLLRQVEPGGDEAAARLDRLLDLKDTAHYGVIYVSGKDLRAALRNAKGLVEFGGMVLRRR